MLSHRFKVSPWTMLLASLSLVLLYTFFTVIQPVGAALGAALLQNLTGAPTVPPYLNYQGMLRDAEGKPISGSHKLVFRIYRDVTAPLPEALWMEEHADVTVRDGQFSVLLGNNKPLPPEIFTGPDRFIGVTVDSLDEMVPRQRFASAPYAMYADHAASLIVPNGSGATAVHVDQSGRVGVGTTSPQAQMQINSSSAITTALQVEGTVRTNNGNTLLAQGSGRVGVGVNNPLAAVHVGGPDPDLLLDGPSNSAARAELYFGIDGQPRSALYYDKNNGDMSMVDGGSYFSLDDAGQNAVGPRLNVNGDLRAAGNFYLGPTDRKPVKIVRITHLPENVGPVFPNVPAADYECTVGSWSSGRYDINEAAREVTKVWTYTENGWWWVGVNFPSHNKPHDIPSVDVVCFLKGMVEYDTTFGVREDLAD